MTNWLHHSKKPTKYYGRLTKTLQALEDMWNSGPSLLEHQNWSTWWKNTSRRAKYAQRDFEAEKDFRLFDFLTKKAHLNMILDPPDQKIEQWTFLPEQHHFVWILKLTARSNGCKRHIEAALQESGSFIQGMLVSTEFRSSSRTHSYDIVTATIWLLGLSCRDR